MLTAPFAQGSQGVGGCGAASLCAGVMVWGGCGASLHKGARGKGWREGTEKKKNCGMKSEFFRVRQKIVKKRKKISNIY